MFNFNGITHLIDNGNGTIGAVGSVPVGMMTKRRPTISDVMGGRVRNGWAYVGRAFASVDEALTVARESGARLCQAKNCACREVFSRATPGSTA